MVVSCVANGTFWEIENEIRAKLGNRRTLDQRKTETPSSERRREVRERRDGQKERRIHSPEATPGGCGAPKREGWDRTSSSHDESDDGCRIGLLIEGVNAKTADLPSTFWAADSSSRNARRPGRARILNSKQ